MITHEELLDLLDYDKETGIFRWKKANNRKIKAGSVAGCKNNGIITIKHKKYKIGRLAWFYINKKWPNGDITHLNDIKTDNRICNLKTGSIRGLKTTFNPYYDKTRKRWRSTIMVYRKQIYLGSFATEQEAKDAITNYKLKLEESGIL